MRAHTLVTKRAVVEEVEREFDRRYWEIFDNIASDVAQQALSNVLVVLEKSYGFGKIRLNRFVDDVRDMCGLMENPTPLTCRSTAVDNIRYLNDKYGINLKNFKIETYHDTTRRRRNET